jgi:copper(I)-binding protein
MRQIWLLVVTLAALVVAACAAAPASARLQIVDPWARSAPLIIPSTPATAMPGMAMPTAAGQALTGGTGAVYLTIKNSGDLADRLIKVETSATKAAEIHQDSQANGMLQMTQVNAIDVRAHGQVALAPGGLHIMLVGLNQALTAGQTITLKLTFEKSGEISVQAAIRD